MDHQETRHGHEGSQPYLPPVTPASVSTAQLPADVEPFIGRTTELGAQIAGAELERLGYLGDLFPERGS
jgi:hypothetical protein